MRTTVLLVILGFCIIRTLSYAIYTIKDGNVSGGVSLIVLTLLLSGAYITIF